MSADLKERTLINVIVASGKGIPIKSHHNQRGAAFNAWHVQPPLIQVFLEGQRRNVTVKERSEAEIDNVL
jgi:hypothetical protein